MPDFISTSINHTQHNEIIRASKTPLFQLDTAGSNAVVDVVDDVEDDVCLPFVCSQTKAEPTEAELFRERVTFCTGFVYIVRKP